MKITIFHYHLLPGGVTQVIISSVVSILKYIPEITNITLVCGKKENSTQVMDTIKAKVPEHLIQQTKLSLEVMPELDYFSEQATPPNSKELTQKLTKRFPDSIWWIHNFQLGKNPVFTRSLITVAETFPTIKIIFQIHDFPECGRYQYIKELKQLRTEPLYPLSPNVRYVVINARDKKLLISAGISKNQVFLLENPLEESPPLPNTFPDKKLDIFFTKTEPSYLPGRPVLIYPVRSIRRKNVLEAGLITRLLPGKVNLFITLPGISTAERDYSRKVDYAFTEGLIQGVFASGVKGKKAGIDFFQQIAASSGILSSSVQEGFGYLFINALQWEKPLLARYLDIFEGTETIFAHQNAHFYTDIRVPVEKYEKVILKEQYLQKIAGISRFITEQAVLKLKNELTGMIAEKFIDFSFLSVDMQLSFLEKLKDKELLYTVQSANSMIIRNIKTILSFHGEKCIKPDLNRFSLEKHAGTIKQILNSLHSETKISRKNGISSNLLLIFAKLEYLKLIYD